MDALVELVKNNYETAIESIKKLFSNEKVIQSTNREEFNANVALNQFDVLLFYSLMQITKKDGTFQINNAKIFKNLVRHFDFVNYLNSIGCYYEEHALSWDDLLTIDPPSFDKVMHLIKPHIKEISDDFIGIFSIADAFTPEHNYLLDLKENVLKILYVFVNIENGKTINENVNDSIILDCIKSIDKRKGEIIIDKNK